MKVTEEFFASRRVKALERFNGTLHHNLLGQEYD